MVKWPEYGLRFCVYLVADWPALHEDDGVMTILAGDRRRQPGNEPCLSAPCDLLEALRGQMVTLIDDEMSILADSIVDDSLTNQALNKRHIHHAAWLAAPAADAPNSRGRSIQE
jgi:hypothetical protein